MVGADYDKIKKFVKKNFAKMDTKSDPEIDAWTIRGSTFHGLRRISEVSDFSQGSEFSKGSNCSKRCKFSKGV